MLSIMVQCHQDPRYLDYYQKRIIPITLTTKSNIIEIKNIYGHKFNLKWLNMIDH